MPDIIRGLRENSNAVTRTQMNSTDERTATPAISVDESQVRRIAAFFKDHADFSPFPFASDDKNALFPPVEHPLAVDFFFAMSKHQFGFWFDAEHRYLRPMWAAVGGKAFKGSDYIWRMGMRMLAESPEFFSPSFQKNVTAGQLDAMWRCDAGGCPLPDMQAHLALLNGYGEDMERLGTAPAGMVRRAKAEPSPARYLSDALATIRGYGGDPMRKKINMLIMILQNRPERFLPKEDIPPIVDYHVMRLSLRTGVVRVDSADLREKLVRREFASAEEERSVRRAVYEGVERIKAEAGVGTPEIDWLFFSGRKWCPEMETPDCAGCVLSRYCAKKTELFQPVYRTTAY